MKEGKGGEEGEGGSGEGRGGEGEGAPSFTHGGRRTRPCSLCLMGSMSITEQLKAQRKLLGQKQYVSIIISMNLAINLDT